MAIDKIKDYSIGIGRAIGRKIRKVVNPTIRVPNRWTSSKEYAAKSETSRWHQVYGPTEVEVDEPKQFGERTADFHSWLDSSFPPLGVLELRNAYLVGKHGWVVTDDGFFLPEHSWYGRHVDEMTLFPGRSPLMRRIDPSVSVQRLEGTCLSLTSDWSGVNYGHFLLDGISRFELFKRAGFSLSEVDHVLVPYPNPGWGRFIDQLGFREKIVQPQRRVAFEADRVLAPSFPGTRANYPQFVVDFLQREFLSEEHRPSRRLYIPRTTTRQITNEDTVISILKDLDFEVFEPVEHNNPPRVFSEAEVVVGAHGAGLTDIAFCQPGTKVLELIPSDHVRPYWYTLAESADLTYTYMIGQSVQERENSMVGRSPYDFTIKENELRSALKELLQNKNVR